MIKAMVRRLPGKVLGDAKGVTSLEYAVLAVFLVVAVIAAAGTLGKDISNALTTIGSSL